MEAAVLRREIYRAYNPGYVRKLPPNNAESNGHEDCRAYGVGVGLQVVHDLQGFQFLEPACRELACNTKNVIVTKVYA